MSGTDNLRVPLHSLVRQNSILAREPKRAPHVVALFTIFGVGTSFLTFQTVITALSNISENGFVPCNSECTFIRYFGGGNVPPSAPAFLNCGNNSDLKYCNSTTPVWQLNTSDDIPGYVQITNGDLDIQFAPFPMQGNLILAMDLWKSETPYIYAFASPVCPDLDVPMQEKCNQTDMKARIHNHLTDAPSLTALRGLICAWAVLLVVHELLVLYRAPEEMSTCFGMLSTAAHIGTTGSAFLWALGATDVFLAEDPNQPCGCYYTLPALNCLMMLATPALMQKTAWDMLWKTALGLIHGDFLHTVSYSVPMRMVQSSELSDPTTTFLPPTANGDTQHAAPLLPHKHRHGSCGSCGLVYLKGLQSQVSLFIVVYFSGPPLVSKVMMITREGVQHMIMVRDAWISQESWFTLPAAMSTSPNVGLAVAMTFACLLGPPYCVYKQWNPVRGSIREIMVVLENFGTQSLFQPKLPNPYRGPFIHNAMSILTLFVTTFVTVASIINGTLSSWSLMGVWWTPADGITAELAAHWGSDGVWFAAMFVASYFYAGLPWKFLMEGFFIKNGGVPKLGLNHIKWLDETFPILGLANERQLAELFMIKNKTSSLCDSYYCDDESYAEWKEHCGRIEARWAEERRTRRASEIA